jgi:ArsR family metal-binding transcriptional regulator
MSQQSEEEKEGEFLLRGFTITRIRDCIADPNKNRVIAELSDDVSPVFPYLNATISNLMYNPGANTVTFRREGRLLTFYPHVAVMAKVDGEEDAWRQLEWFRQLCNRTWQKRHEITPSYQRQILLRPLDVYVLLPRKNCKACGEATCMAFAFALLEDRRRLEECTPLQEEKYAEGGRRLAELLG